MQFAATIQWLLSGDPWVEYGTRIELLGEPVDSPRVVATAKKLKQHPSIRAVLKDIGNWDREIVNSHKSAGLAYHKLLFLIDAGLDNTIPEIKTITDKMLQSASEEGPFRVMMNIPVHFGGTGLDGPAWALCDAPNLVNCLAKLGMANDPRVLKARDFLTALCRDNGFPCVVSKELGKFRGPGKKDDPCPYATLAMLRLLTNYPSEYGSHAVLNSVEKLLSLWENSVTEHPYMFFMGKDFRKLKAPFVWYDLLHFAEVLSYFPFARGDKRFLSIIETIKCKADTEGKFTPESEWKAWKGWDFGQKKHPSAWLTFLVYRLLKRIENEYPDL